MRATFYPGRFIAVRMMIIVVYTVDDACHYTTRAIRFFFPPLFGEAGKARFAHCVARSVTIHL